MKVIRKEKRIFTFPTVCLLIAVMILSCTATYAWYAVNKKVEEDTFGVSVKVTPNLIISNSEGEIATLTASRTTTFTDADAATRKYTPATHYDGGEALDGLYCLDNNDTVSRETGFSDTASLVELPSDEKYYYRECAVYVAATDVAIENAGLSITLQISGKDAADLYSYRAGSVDFYLNDYTEANFKGTLNLAGLDAKVNDGSTEKTSLFISVPGDLVPQNTDGCIVLLMRFYFDGALKFYDEELGKYRAFVNTDTVSAEEIRFDVLISDTQVPQS